MAAAGHAYGMAPVCDRYKSLVRCHLEYMLTLYGIHIDKV